MLKSYPSAPVTLETGYSGSTVSDSASDYSVAVNVSWLKATLDTERRVLRLVVDTAAYARNPTRSSGTATLRKGSESRAVTVQIYRPLDFHPQRAVTDPTRPRVYIQTNGFILSHDTERNRPLASFFPAAGFDDWALAADGKQLVTVKGGARRIDRFDLATLQPAAPLFLPSEIPQETFSDGTWRIAGGRDGLLYLTPGRIPARLYVIDSATGALKQTLAPAGAESIRIGSLVPAPDGTRLWAMTSTASLYTGGLLRLAELTTDRTTGALGTFRFASNPLPLQGESLFLSASGDSAYTGYTRLDLSADAPVAPIEHLFVSPTAVSPDDAFIAYHDGLRSAASLSDENILSLPDDRIAVGFSNDGRHFLDFSRSGKLTKTDLLKLLGRPLLAQPIQPAQDARVSPPDRLAWTAVPGAKSYTIHLASPGATLGTTATRLGETTAAEFTALPALKLDTTYRWRVDAHHSGGVLRGPVHSFTTALVAARPESLTHHTVQGVAADELTLDLIAASSTASWSLSSDRAWLAPVVTSGQGSARLTIRVDASALPPGAHQGSLTLATSGGSARIPVSIEVSPLRIVQLSNRPGTGECHALSQTGQYESYRSFLLRVDASDGSLIRARLLDDERRPRFARHPATGALYVYNVVAGRIDFFDPESLELSRSVNVARTGGWSQFDVILPPLPGPANSLLFADQLLDLSSGVVQPLANSLAGSTLSAASAPDGFRFYVGPGRYPPLRQISLEADRFALSASAKPPASEGSFAGGYSLVPYGQSFVVSEDGSTVFDGGVVYDTNLAQIGENDDHIQSCSKDGRVAIGRRLVHLRPADGPPATKILPDRFEISAFNDATGRIVLARDDGRPAILDPDQLPALAAPVIAPVSASDESIRFSVDWPQATSRSAGCVYQQRIKGAAAWEGVRTGIFQPDATPSLGAAYLQADTEYEFRFCIYTQGARESGWSPVIAARTAIRRPFAVPPYTWNATPVDVDAGETIALPLPAFTGEQMTYRLEDAPEGLEFDGESMSFHGAVPTPGRYTVRLVAENPGGSAAVYIALLVRNTKPLGSTSRYVGRQGSTFDPLDGWWTLTRSGEVFSGAIHTYVGTVSIKGRLVPENDDILSVYLNRKLQGVPVSLYVRWDRALDRCTVDLYTEDFGSSTASDSGYASTWNKQNNPYPNALTYTALLLTDEDELGEDMAGVPVPDGVGHLRLVLGADGAASLYGENALGGKFTRSTFVDDRHAVPLFHIADAGIVHGFLVVEEQDKQPRLAGALEWTRFTHEDSKTYPQGFMLPLLVGGAPLPATGRDLPPLAPLANETGRAELLLSGGALPFYGKPIAQNLAPTAAGLDAPKPGSADNPHRVSLKIDRVTGLVTGSASLLNPASKPHRTLSFRGRLVKNPLGDDRDFIGGYFLLPTSTSSGHTLSGLLQVSEPEPADDPVSP